jgi:ABC-type sulfate/molybdate transport systems ATPase subunit
MLNVHIDTPLNRFRLRISFDCQPGITALLGPSGSGKSMAIKCIAGLYPVEHGMISLDSHIYLDSTKKINVPARLRRFGVAFQQPTLFPHMTVRENIIYGINNLEPHVVLEKFNMMSELFELKEIANLYPKTISGGQAQRVSIARALAIDPKVLILDEPFNALDDALKSRVINRVASLQKQKDMIVLVVTHSFEELAGVAHASFVVKDGEIDRAEG